MTRWIRHLCYLFIPALLALAACRDASDDAGERDTPPAGDASPAGEPASGQLTTLSYNVAGLPQEVSQVNPEKHIPLISPLLNDYDIVLTQEDFDFYSGKVLAAKHYVNVVLPLMRARVGVIVAGDRSALDATDGGFSTAY